MGEYLVLALPLMVGQSIAVLDEQFVRLVRAGGGGGDRGPQLRPQSEHGARSVSSRRLPVLPPTPSSPVWRPGGDEPALIATTSRAARTTVFVAAGPLPHSSSSPTHGSPALQWGDFRATTPNWWPVS